MKIKLFDWGIYLFFILNIADWISTRISLNIGLNYEVNYFFVSLNMNLEQFFVFKLFLCFIYSWLFYKIYENEKFKFFMPTYILAIDCTFLYLVLHNLYLTFN